jgi:anti-sigma factor RsiW
MFRLPGMITCARAEELIDDFCEGGLAAGERRRAYVHFRVCPDCRSYLAAYRRTIELGKAVFEHPDAQAAPEVSEKLAQSVLESAGKST